MINNSKRQVGIWLLCGVAMFLIQIFLGGATRLTGSGLSITEWKLIHGVIPPMNEQQWQEEFDAYKNFPQFKLTNSDMSLSEFKHIFFWEFFHRLWGRLIGVAFIIPFIYFLVKKKIDSALGKKLILLFLLGAVQGLIGWLMVKSGLFPEVEDPMQGTAVNPVKLSIHLSLAAILVGALLWVALDCMQLKKEELKISKRQKNFSLALLILIFVQVIYGGLMAGHHAAIHFSTWPKIGNAWIPADMFALSPFVKNLFYNVELIQLIHRTLAYLIFVFIFIYWFRFRHSSKTKFLTSLINLLPVIVSVQVLLGIFTLLQTNNKIPILLAELHQMVGLSLLFVVVAILFQERNKFSKQN